MALGKTVEGDKLLEPDPPPTAGGSKQISGFGFEATATDR